MNLKLNEMNLKDLRGLRIKLNNRINSLKSFGKPKELQKSHLLFGLELGECEQLLHEVKRAERELK